LAKLLEYYSVSEGQDNILDKKQGIQGHAVFFIKTALHLMGNVILHFQGENARSRVIMMTSSATGC